MNKGVKLDLSISEIFIKNFKGIKELRYYPHEDFNIIIGENNIGKSTIFEAIQLWEKCYTSFIQSNLKSDIR
ncbi:AAA family ATPase [Acinetobacter baumannii]|uniref:AAA family ATPase n=1 Tax=Acinetobacter baumannii TaxID=470 RepID=UPI001D0DA074|nr:AAA family ATPase [Acinetobacter baumannii]